MFKTLVLSALYNLSDDQIEYQVRDRLSFMRFLGLGLGNLVPDAKTVWLCRDALAQAGQVEALFSQFVGHLARQGYIARGGQILDASIVPVPCNQNTRGENAAIKKGEVPEEWKNMPSKRCQKDKLPIFRQAQTAAPSGHRSHHSKTVTRCNEPGKVPRCEDSRRARHNFLGCRAGAVGRP